MQTEGRKIHKYSNFAKKKKCVITETCCPRFRHGRFRNNSVPGICEIVFNLLRHDLLHGSKNLSSIVERNTLVGDQ